MRQVTFDPDMLDARLRARWDGLLISADRAKAALAVDRSNGSGHRWRSEVWKGFKQFLSDYIFFGMCAYCESAVEAVYPGDAEHYRPKGKVTQRGADGREVVVVDGNGKAHPGYYWLAYDWRNVLPSCYKCNTSHGKGTQFPAAKHAFSPMDGRDPDALDQLEEPFLLHPCRKDFSTKKSFAFDNLGGIEPKDGNRQADVSIKVYDLKRGALRDRRLEAYTLAWNYFRDARERALKDGRSLMGIMKEYEEGRKPHSAAALLYVGRMIAAEMRANMEALGGTLET